MQNTATRQLTRLERLGIVVFMATVVVFGGLVELRSAFLSRRMGDLGCYLRPGWAATVGESIYDTAEDNGWHYNYPPLYAILMVPLADPPAGADHSGYIPYPVSVVIVYILNILCLCLAVHLLASAIERYSADPAFGAQPPYCRRWWALRMWPTLVCLAPFAHTAMRGQVNLQILALLCGWIACSLGNRRVLGGTLLGVAITIKVIPIYLLVYSLWNREWRTIAGCGIGLFAGLVVVPLAYLGPTRTVEEYKEYGHVFFGPLMKLSDDTSRENELLGMNATDSMGIKHALHNWRYRDPASRPREMDRDEEWAHRILGVLMTLAVLWPLRGKQAPPAWRTIHAVGCLLILMVIFSPVSHVHYFAFCLPLVMSQLMRRWQFGTSLQTHVGLFAAFLWFMIATTLPAVTGLEYLRDLCLPLFGALPLWTIGVVDLWRGEAAPAATAVIPARLAA